MTVDQKMSNGFSRRSLLTAGLAGGFLFAFHVPVRAVNEPVQPPEMQLWLQMTAEPQAPVSTHVWTPLPEHCVEFGAHTPVHAPIAHA